MCFMFKVYKTVFISFKNWIEKFTEMDDIDSNYHFYVNTALEVFWDETMPLVYQTFRFFIIHTLVSDLMM